MPATVGDDERLARYALSKSWLYKDKRAGSPLRPNAWMPLPHVDLSVYRISEWDEPSILAQGNQVAEDREANHKAAQIAEGKPYPEGKRTFRYLGRGEINARDVRANGLEVVPEEPPPRHAIIIGWPPLTGNRKHDEATQMALAYKLSEKSAYVAA